MLTRREQRRAEIVKRRNAPIVEVNLNKLTAAYQKKMVARMKIFYAEARRMDSKLPKLIEKVGELGYVIDKLTMNSYDVERLNNYRRRSNVLQLDVVAHRNAYEFTGWLTVSPASMRLVLNCSKLKKVITPSGWSLPHLKIAYYRTLNVKDNYLAALVGGSVYKKEDAAEEF